MKKIHHFAVAYTKPSRKFNGLYSYAISTIETDLNKIGLAAPYPPLFIHECPTRQIALDLADLWIAISVGHDVYKRQLLSRKEEIYAAAGWTHGDNLIPKDTFEKEGGRYSDV